MSQDRSVTKTRQIILVLLAIALAVNASPVSAAVCSVNSQSVSFGNYDSLSELPLDGVGNVTVSCDSAVDFSVSLDAGGGSYENRRMIGGSRELRYNLYTDSTRIHVWGDASLGSGVSATGTTVNLPVYGRIPGRQNVPAGTYGDTIILTVSY